MAGQESRIVCWHSGNRTSNLVPATIAPVATASIIFTLIENLPSPFDEHTGTARPASPPPAELLPRIALESFAASDSARADELESAAPADALA